MTSIGLSTPYPTRTRASTILGRLSVVLAVAVPRFGRWLARTAPRVRQLALYVGGLGCLTAGAWTVSTTLGLVVAGVSCLVLEWLSAPSSHRSP